MIPLILVFAAIAVGAVHAAAPDVDVSVGFDNLFSQGKLTPVSVQVRSPDAPLDAELVVEYTAGTALEKLQRYRVRRDVSLPAGFSGVYRFLLPLKAGTYPLIVRLDRNGGTLVEQEVELRPMAARGPVVVGLSRRPSLDALIPDLDNLFGRRPHLIYPRTEYLPVDALGWEGVDLVIWHDLLPGDPDPASLEALAGWIVLGGTLVVFDGPWLAGDGLPTVLRATEEESGARSWSLGYGRVVLLGQSPDELAGFPAGVAPADRSFRTAADASASRVADAAFRRVEPPSGPVGRHLIVPAVFLFVSAGIILAGGKWLQIAALALVSVLATGTVMLLPESRFEDPEVSRMEIMAAGSAGTAISRSEIRIVSPGSGIIDLPLEAGGVPVMPSGTDVSLRLRRDGAELTDLEIIGWREQRIIRETVIRPDEADPDTAWRDAVLVSDGTLRMLPGWQPGDLPVPAGVAFDPDDPGGLSGGLPPDYLRILGDLAGQSGTTIPIILARDGPTRLLVYPGAGAW